MSKWEMVLLPNVVFFQEGPGVRNTQYTSSGVKLLNVANLRDGKIDLSTSNRYISEDEAYGKYKHFLVDDGDFIVASSGIQVDYFDKKMGFINSSHLPLCMNTSTIRFKVLDEKQLFIWYFMHCLKTPQFKEQLNKLITGSAQLNFGPSHIKQMFIPLPPLPIQQQIADALDRANALIEKRKKQIEKLDLLIKSQFIEMFGDPVTNPKGWDVDKLSSMGEINRGVSKHRPRNDPKLLGGTYPLIQTGDVANSDLYIKEYTSTYSELGLAQSKIWDKDTLCITIAANIAKTGILAFSACFPDSVVGFIPNKKTNIFFVNYWFSFFQKILEEQAPESAQKNINLKILNDLNIICPTINLQNEFAYFVEKVETQKKLLQQSLEKMELSYKSLMQKCFRGEIFS